MTGALETIEPYTDPWDAYENLSEHTINDTATSSVDDGNIVGGVSGRPPSSSVANLVCSGVFMALIIITNIISLVAFAVEKRLRTYNNYFIINLSILDLLVGVSLAAQVAHAYHGYYPFSQDVCKILTGVAGGIVNGSNISVVVICVDRHRAVYDPINHFVSRTKRRAVIINLLPWVIGFSFWLSYTTVWEFIVGHDNGTQCMPRFSENPITYMIQNVCKFHLPFVIIVVLYTRIILRIQKTARGRSVNKKFATEVVSSSSSCSDKTGSSVIDDVVNDKEEVKMDTKVGPLDDNVYSVSKQTTTGQRGPSQRVESASETRKATRTLTLIVVSFVITWIPFSVISLILSIDPMLIRGRLPISVFILFAFMTFGNNLLNPISYFVSQPLFRATVIRVLTCRAW